MKPVRIAALAIGAVLLVTAGCTSGDSGDDQTSSGPSSPPGTDPVTVLPPHPGKAQVTRCQSLVASLPDRLVGQTDRAVVPSDRIASAWGDPPVVLRCGVAEPAALRPTSFCFVVDEVGWLTTIGGSERPPTSPTHETQVFTTIGRSPYVELTVPGAYADEAAAALAGVASAVRSNTHLDRDSCL